MRELKFRAYIKPLKRYATGLDTIQFHKCCDVAGAGIWTVVTVNEGIFEGDDIIIEQYTDEYDVNNKEIAEGDIVQYVSANEEDLVQATVKYGYPYGYDNEDGTLFVKGFFYGDCKMDDFVDLTEEEYEDLGGTKIIGNIHENSELLESKK